MKRLYLLPAIAAALTLLLSVNALGYNSDWRNADVRVIHASPDAPPVDVWVNGQVAFAGAPFTGVTEYASLASGDYNVQVVPAGETEPVVINADLKLRPRQDYTVLATGTLAEIEPLVLRDRNNWVPHYGSRLRVVHASPDAPAVDVIANGRMLARGLEYQEASRYLNLRPGTYDLELQVTGTNDVALSLPDVEIGNGAILTAVAVGEVGEGTLDAIIAVDKTR